MLCYETMVVLPVLLLARDFQQGRLADRRRARRIHGGHMLLCIVYLVARHWLSSRVLMGQTFHDGFAPDTKAIHLSLSAPWFLWRHFLMWIFPFGTLELLGSYGWMRSASPLSLAGGWLFLAGLVAVVAWTWRWAPEIAMGLFVYLVLNLPAGNFVPGFNGPIEDYYVTIPSIGLVIAFAGICRRLWQVARARRRDVPMVASVAWLALGFLLVFRGPVCGAYFHHLAGVWAKPVELMLRVAETRPFQYKPQAQAAMLLVDNGYPVEAEKLALAVLDEAPWCVLRAGASRRRRFSRTRPRWAKCTTGWLWLIRPPRRSRVNWQCWSWLRCWPCKPAKRDEAAALCRAILAMPEGTRQPAAIGQFAQIYLAQGDREKARATLRRGLTLYPADARLCG